MSSNRLKYLVVQALTFGRVPLILVFLAVTLWADTRESSLWFLLAFGSMVLSAATDLVDGYLARKFNVTSTLGAYADPLADKVFYLTAFPTLVYLACHQREVEGAFMDMGATFHAKFLLVLAIFFLLRDQWVSFLRSIGALSNMDARANWSGKARTVVSFPVICMVYYYLQAPADSFWGLAPLYRWPLVVYCAEGLSLTVNIISIWAYTTYYWPALTKEVRPPAGDEKGGPDMGG